MSEKFREYGNAFTVNFAGDADPVGTKLDYYFRSNSVYERTPILLGMTGVAKSAMVKFLAEKYGYRMIDLRCAFMHRLDFEGLMQRMDVGDMVFSYNAPEARILEATDNYIEFCEKSVQHLEGRLSGMEKGSKEYETLSATLKKLREKSKTPVLFFDEVTRADEAIRNALMKILNEKRFLNFSMTRAKVVSATNFPEGLPTEMAELYQVSQTTDAAFNDRFEPIHVHDRDVCFRWFEWARQPWTNPKTGEPEKGRQNIHPLVVDFLVRNQHHVYNIAPLIKAFEKSGSLDDLSTVSFSNYRSWELVSNYLYAKRGEKLSGSMIAGLVGKTASTDFLAYLREDRETIKKNYGISLGRDSAADKTMDHSIEEAIKTATPLLLCAHTSFGKTTRIREIAKKFDAEVIEISLALQDRVDIMGPPVKVPIVQYLVGMLGNTEIEKELEAIAKRCGLPQMVTLKAPKMDLALRMSRAIKAGRHVILSFDEMNRVSNESIMSAVFEAISDFRLFGVSFSKNRHLVTVIASCNLGDDYEDVKRLDPAFAARFCIDYRPEYTENDVDGMLNYMKEREFHPSIIGWLSKQNRPDVLRMIAKASTRGLGEAVPSMRAFSDLNRVMKDPVYSEIFDSVCLFADSITSNKITKLFVADEKVSDYDSFRYVCGKISSGVDDWCGKAVDIRGNSASGKDIPVQQMIDDFFVAHKGFEEKKTTAFDCLRVVKALYAVESAVLRFRNNILYPILGPEADSFLLYHNSISGKEKKTAGPRDLFDIAAVHTFWDNRLAAFATPKDVIDGTMKGIEEIFKSGVANDLNCAVVSSLLLTPFEYVTNNDARKDLLVALLSGPADPLLSMVDDKPFAEMFYAKAGIANGGDLWEDSKNFVPLSPIYLTSRS